MEGDGDEEKVITVRIFQKYWEPVFWHIAVFVYSMTKLSPFDVRRSSVANTLASFR